MRKKDFIFGAPLPTHARVVKHPPMERFKMTKDKVRDFSLVGLILAGFVMWCHDQDQKAEARGDYYACYTDSCRQEVTAAHPTPDPIRTY